MRSRNINLKKKIAFIASVAMMATTAAYLPMDAFAVQYKGANGYSVAATKTENGVATTVETFDIFIKVNGKYLAQDNGTTSSATQYKLFNTLEAAKSANYYLVNLNGVTWTQGDGTKDVLTHGKDWVATTAADTNYNYLYTTSADEVVIPYFAEAGSAISLEFAARKGSSLSSRSVESIDVTLDDNGIAKVPEQKSYVIGYSDNSNYDEKAEDFVDVKGDHSAATTNSSYEVLDLSNLQIRMGAANGSAVDSKSYNATDVKVKDTTKTAALNTLTIATGDAYPDADDATPVSYSVKKVNGKYAKVLTTTLDNTEKVEPDTQLKVQTGVYNTWSKSSNVASDGTVTLKMGNDGYAVSDLVTFTKDGVSEYYVYVVKNAATVEEKAQYDAKIKGVAGTKGTAADVLGTATALNAQGRYKVTRKLTAESFGDNTYDNSADWKVNEKLSNDDTPTADDIVKITTYNKTGTAPTVGGVTATKTYNDGSTDYYYFTNAELTTIAEKKNALTKSKKRYITEYTIYNNEIDDAEYSSSESDAAHYIDIELSAPAAGLVDGQASAKGSKVLNQTSTNAGDFFVGGSQGTSIDKGLTKVRIAKTDAGTATSDIIKTASGNYIRFVFTTDYQIKFYNNSDTKYTDNVDADGKVDVSGRTITQPDTPDNKGHKFKGWKVYTTADGKAWAEAASKKYAFSAAAGTEQVNDAAAEITPNTKLVADYDGMRYKVTLNAGEGVLTTTADASESAFGKYFGENVAKTAEMNLEDIGTGDFAKVNDQKAAKEGYKFKGWSTKENDTTVLTAKTFKEAFPGENKTLNLYPVYEATKPTTSFKVFAFSNAKQLTTDGKYSTVKNAYINATSAEIGNTTYEVKMGEKLGTLPTPKLKGYTFNGWYVAKYTTTNVSAVKVDENTVVDEAIIDTLTNGTLTDTNPCDKVDASATLTLYAKFTQNEYKITYDLGDGEWDTTDDYDKANSNKAVTYKVDNAGAVKYYNGNATDITSNVFKVEPKVGSGNFTKFTGWTINNDTRKYTTATALANAIKNMDEAADLTIKATYKKDDSASQSSIVLNANADDAKFYGYTEEDSNGKAKGKLYPSAKTLSSEMTPGTKVASIYEINNEQIGQVGDTTGAIVARPGYTFTGWYTDAECTTPYTFDEFPEKGVETVVYAGWKAGTSTRYKINFNLINKDTSYVAASDKINYAASDDSDFTFTATFGGVTGSDVKAADKKFEVDGKTYNFSEKDSAGLDTEKELKAAYRLGYAKGAVVVDSIATADFVTAMQSIYGARLTSTINSGTTVLNNLNDADKKLIAAGEGIDWVLAENVDGKDVGPNGLGQFVTTNEKTGLNTGAFVLDSEQYTVIQGNYVEDYVEEVKELGKATNVKVSDKGAVTFTAADNAVKYQVCKIVDGKKYYSAKTDATTINITPAKKDYQVYVIAFDENGKSTHSATVNVTVKAALGTVKNPKVTESLDDSGNKIGTVTWDKVEGATWYKVFKVVNGKTYWGSKVTENKYVFKNLPKDSSYIIYVAAGDDNGNVTYGARTKISKYPAVQNVKISADKKTVTFDKAEGAVNYQVAKLINGKTYYGTKSESNSITLQSAAKSGTQIFVLAFFTGEDGKTYSSYSQSITVE